MGSDTLVKTVFLKAAPERVWAFLTEAEKLASWFNPAEADLCAGGDYVLLEPGAAPGSAPLCWGRVSVMEPPRRLVYSFTVRPLKGAMTTVSWTLEAVAGGTRLTLVHEGIAGAAGAATGDLLAALDAGWDGHVAHLREVAASCAPK